MSEQKSEQHEMAEAAYPFWRYHLWSIGYGSYNEIEAAIDAGKLQVFTCTKTDCDCKWPKQPNTPVSQPSGEGPELPSCPFCPTKTRLYFAVRDVGWQEDREIDRRVVVVCAGCGAQGPAFGFMSFNTESTAAQYWNTRAPSPDSIREKARRVAGTIAKRWGWVGKPEVIDSLAEIIAVEFDSNEAQDGVKTTMKAEGER